ncbi:hypothetical protein BV25DRAFT_1155682 [Artomyces pyxidatus]|uniref:Uncharacterized protein n=1 Tax=Artomyces pyxidatus TaxID=48021 RepID=A0ACB8STM7_9AGAM|nr:hypothetical protein BV25DRAFT_1155682 [Artomyces pyxidatus]
MYVGERMHGMGTRQDRLCLPMRRLPQVVRTGEDGGECVVEYVKAVIRLRGASWCSVLVRGYGVSWDRGGVPPVRAMAAISRRTSSSSSSEVWCFQTGGVRRDCISLSTAVVQYITRPEVLVAEVGVHLAPDPGCPIYRRCSVSTVPWYEAIRRGTAECISPPRRVALERHTCSNCASVAHQRLIRFSRGRKTHHPLLLHGPRPCTCNPRLGPPVRYLRYAIR